MRKFIEGVLKKIVKRPGLVVKESLSQMDFKTIIDIFNEMRRKSGASNIVSKNELSNKESVSFRPAKKSEVRPNALMWVSNLNNEIVINLDALWFFTQEQIREIVIHELAHVFGYNNKNGDFGISKRLGYEGINEAVTQMIADDVVEKYKHRTGTRKIAYWKSQIYRDLKPYKDNKKKLEEVINAITSYTGENRDVVRNSFIQSYMSGEDIVNNKFVQSLPSEVRTIYNDFLLRDGRMRPLISDDIGIIQVIDRFFETESTIARIEKIKSTKNREEVVSTAIDIFSEFRKHSTNVHIPSAIIAFEKKLEKLIGIQIKYF